MQQDSIGFDQFRFNVGSGDNANPVSPAVESPRNCNFFLYAKDGCMFRDHRCNNVHDHVRKEVIDSNPRPPCRYFYSEFFPQFRHQRQTSCKFGANCWYSHNCVWRKKTDCQDSVRLKALEEENAKLATRIQELEIQLQQKADQITSLTSKHLNLTNADTIPATHTDGIDCEAVTQPEEAKQCYHCKLSDGHFWHDFDKVKRPVCKKCWYAHYYPSL